MKRIDYALIGVVLVITACIYFPVCTAEYCYTDEISQLWHYRKGSGYHMFLPQGRNITDALFQVLFSSVNTIRQVTWLRVFSLAGWMCCIPVWYYLLKQVTDREKLPPALVTIFLLYLVTSPPFTISVAWASCLELFMANTSGLLSGYCLYAILAANRPGRPTVAWGVVLALAAGLISLFTYQNGFGCCMLPFLLHFLAVRKITRTLVTGIAASCLVYIIYFFLFRCSLLFTHAEPSGRTAVHFQPLRKLLFLFARPLNSAFHFTWITDENNVTGFVVYALLAGSWLGMHLFRRRQQPLLQRLALPATIFGLLLFVYLPSLLVKENYASNRTLLAFNTAVFLVVAEAVLHGIGRKRQQWWFAAIAGACFACNAWYNLNTLFLQPVTAEYRLVRTYLEQHYTSNISEVWVERPPRNLFRSMYGITRSWDEFGVPSTYPEWVPEFFVKQVVFEATGSRAVADRLTVRHWLAADTAAKPPFTQPTYRVLYVPVERIMTREPAVHP